MTSTEQFFLFFRQKFDLLLVAGLFTFVFVIYVWDTNPDPERANKLYTIWNGLLYAFLALLGVRATSSQQPTIGPATTQSGDVNIQQPTTPADPAKDNKQNEIPKD